MTQRANRIFLLWMVGATLGLMLADAHPVCAQASTDRVSETSEGYAGNSLSTRPSLSNFGQWVFFESYATNLYHDDVNGREDVFVLMPPGLIGLASVGPGYVQGNSDSYDAVTVADGTAIAFASASSNLVDGDTNQQTDVFVRGPTPDTVRVSIGPSGSEGNGISYDPSISADGRYVAFSSYADNFVASDTNDTIDVFVHDRQTGVTKGISNNGYIGQGNGASYGPAISGDGRFIAFTTFANNYLWSPNPPSSQKNLTPIDTNNSPDVYVYDQLADTIERVSVSSEGEQGNGWSHHAAISEDGRYVAFSSSATNLVPDDPNGLTDFFVHDRHTGVTERVGEDASRHSEGNRNYRNVSISFDGRYVAFSSNSGGLVPGDTNTESDIFVFDREADITERVSVQDDGTESFGDSAFPSLSPEGRDVGFASDATDLAPDDTNNTDDVFVRRSWQTIVIFTENFEGGNFEHWSSIVGFSESCLRHHDSSADDYLFTLTMVPVEDGGFLGKFSPVGYPFEPTTVEIGFTQATGTCSWLDFHVVFYDDDGPGGAPGTFLGSVPYSATYIPPLPDTATSTINVSGAIPAVSSGSIYVGARWNWAESRQVAVAIDTTPSTPLQESYFTTSGGASWIDVTQPGFRSFFIRLCGQ